MFTTSFIDCFVILCLNVVIKVYYFRKWVYFMDFGIIVSLIFSFAMLIVAYILEEGVLSALAQPTAAMIVFGGTIGVIGASFPMSQIKRIPKIFGVAFGSKQQDREALVHLFAELSTNTRKNGLLSLETEIQNGSFDKFMAQGLQMVVDGIEPETVEKTLETKLENMSERHAKGAEIFSAAGGYSPTLGIIGTVFGLVSVLGNLSEPDTLGPKIATAFIATLYGIGAANLIWLPIANRLKSIDAEEMLTKIMILDGILMIQGGSNPRLIEEKLKGYLDHEIEEETRSGE